MKGSSTPDLAVEVLSPDERETYVLDKVGEYLQAGVRLVGVIDPGKQSAAVYRSLTDVREVGAQSFLEGEEVVPGSPPASTSPRAARCSLAEVFD